MKRKIFLGFVLTAAVIITVFFEYEDYSFDRYVSKQNSSEMNISVNQNAPVKSKGGIEISAPIDTVWQVLTKIENWPQWQKNITEAKLKGVLKEGVTFKWKAGGISFTSVVHTLKPKTMVGWIGKTFGTNAVHNWTLKEDNGKTIVKAEESLQGVLPVIFKKKFQENLDQGIKTSLEELKAASEK